MYFSRKLKLLALVAAFPGLCIGCTSVQLRNSAITHSMTLEEIYTQQVLNNLALFIENPDALPFFAFPNQGTTAVQDTGTAGGPGYTATHFVTSPLGVSASRQKTENWVLNPVNDPAKLALMRCAYQQAIAPCIGVDHHASLCPDCKKLRWEFYGPPDRATGEAHFNEEEPCLNAPANWLCWGCKHKIPKNCTAHVGSHCDLYVWVTPEGEDMLTRLTLTILDYAINDPRQFEKRTKTVELYLKTNGTVSDNSTGIKLTATLPIDMPSKTLAALDKSEAYVEFLEKYGKSKAERLVVQAPKVERTYSELTDDQKIEWWTKANPDLPSWPDDLKEAVGFVAVHKINPEYVPTREFLQGRAVFQRKSNASGGLQQFGQLLNAASPSSPSTGH
jgi:hypothetical protein